MTSASGTSTINAVSSSVGISARSLAMVARQPNGFGLSGRLPCCHQVSPDGGPRDRQQLGAAGGIAARIASHAARPTPGRC